MGTNRRIAIVVVAAALSMGVSLQACAETNTTGAISKMKSAPMKSNGSGIDVQYRIDGEPQPGGLTSIVISFGDVTDPLGATVRFTADSGLKMTAPSATHVLPTGATTTVEVSVVPGDGIGYLHVFSTQNGITSVTSIAVQASKSASAMPSSGQLKQTPRGEKILSMPVK